MEVHIKNHLTLVNNGSPEQFDFSETSVQYNYSELPVQSKAESPFQKNEKPIFHATNYKPIVEKDSKIIKKLSSFIRNWMLLVASILVFLTVCGVVLGFYLNGKLKKIYRVLYFLIVFFK